MRILNNSGIQTRPVWHPNHLQRPFNTNFSYKVENALELVKSSLCIPSSTSLSTLDQQKVINILKTVLKTQDQNCDFADLIGESRKKKLLSPDAISLLHVIRKQRNIFAHNSLNPNTRYMRVIFLVAAFALLAEEIQSEQKL